MKQLVLTMLHRLAAGERLVLCTILASSGSTPRGAGARMAVFADGSTCGTVGGGAVERAAQARAVGILNGDAPGMEAYRLNPTQVDDLGMICGGDVTIYFQPIEPETSAHEILKTLRVLLDRDVNVWLRMGIRDGEVIAFSVHTDDTLPEAGRELFRSRAVLARGETTWYVEPVARRGRVCVFGGGHVGKALVPVLAGLGFRVILFDSRPEAARPENFPGAEAVILGDYSRISERLTLREDDYVCVMSPGHHYDLEILAQVLPCRPSYVGCIGSRRKVAAVNAALAERGIPAADIARIHAPIGLPILAETPEEIAISIAAELIRHRREHL